MTADIEEEVIGKFETQFITGLLEALYNLKSPQTGKTTIEEIVYGKFSGH